MSLAAWGSGAVGSNATTTEGVVGTDIGRVDTEEGKGNFPDGKRGGDDGDADEGVGDLGPGGFNFCLITTGDKPLDPAVNEVDKKEDTGADNCGVDNLKDKFGNAFEAEETGDFAADVDGAVVVLGEDVMRGNEL